MRTRRNIPPLAALSLSIAFVIVACGARTGLLVGEREDSGFALDATIDQATADRAPDEDAGLALDAGHDATNDQSVDAPPDRGPDAPTLIGCLPGTCASLGYQCGRNGDGCGNAIDCGQCPAPQVCGTHRYSQCGAGPPCKPKTCADLGFQCGAAGDGCGGTLQCGICQYPDACGGNGVPGRCGNSLPCTNLCRDQVVCDAGTTAITGTVVAGTLPQFGNPDPIYNALVYVPNAALNPFTPGVQCTQCGAEVSGQPLVATQTAADGTFTLVNMPVGMNIPLVIQLGRWRRQVTIPNVPPCATTQLSTDLTRMPRNEGEGDIPHMAVATGNADAIECVLMKMGIDQAEITQPAGGGRVHLYTLNGANAGPGTPPASQLYGDPVNLANYDMVVLPCEGVQAPKQSSDQQNLISYASAGGRAFITHYGYTWLDNDPPFSATAVFNPSTTSGVNQTTGLLDTSFPNGQALGTWMQTVGAASASYQFPIGQPRYNLSSITPPSQRFVTDLNNGLPLQYAFYTPVGAPATAQCGRVVYSDFHIVSNILTNGQTFPGECDSGFLNPQERALEFMLFDLASCIPRAPQNCVPLTCAQQGISCGPAGDGCGTAVNCGPCPAPQTCGGAQNFHCGVPDAGLCIPESCTQQGFTCGFNGDGCGNVMDCGTCIPPQICGGGAKPGVCGPP